MPGTVLLSTWRQRTAGRWAARPVIRIWGLVLSSDRWHPESEEARRGSECGTWSYSRQNRRWGAPLGIGIKEESRRFWERLRDQNNAGSWIVSWHDIANGWVEWWKEGPKKKKKKERRKRKEQNQRWQLWGGLTGQQYQSPGKTQMLIPETLMDLTRIRSVLQTRIFNRVVGSKQYMKTVWKNLNLKKGDKEGGRKKRKPILQRLLVCKPGPPGYSHDGNTHWPQSHWRR